MTTQTTKTYRITKTRSGHTLGDYQGATESEALDAMARDAGYENFEAACEVAPIKDGELLVEELDLLAAEAARTEYVERFASVADAEQFQAQVISAGSLPSCAQLVKDEQTATAEYWRWLSEQWDEMEAERLNAEDAQ